MSKCLNFAHTNRKAAFGDVDQGFICLEVLDGCHLGLTWIVGNVLGIVYMRFMFDLVLFDWLELSPSSFLEISLEGLGDMIICEIDFRFPFPNTGFFVVRGFLVCLFWPLYDFAFLTNSSHSI